MSLIILWIYISLKPPRSAVDAEHGLIILWIYISLKHYCHSHFRQQVWLSFEFTYLSNTSTLAAIAFFVWLSFEFTYLSNLRPLIPEMKMVWLSFEFTYLSNWSFWKNSPNCVWLSFEFTYLSNKCSKIGRRWRFDYPLNLHISQTRPAPRGRD